MVFRLYSGCMKVPAVSSNKAVQAVLRNLQVLAAVELENLEFLNLKKPELRRNSCKYIIH
jgi:hypothetical protein